MDIETANLPQLRILICHKGDHYLCQCLEWDIAAQGKTLPEMAINLVLTLAGHFVIDMRAKRRAMSRVPAAPQYFHDIYARQSVPMGVPHFEPPQDGVATAEAMRQVEAAEFALAET